MPDGPILSDRHQLAFDTFERFLTTARRDVREGRAEGLDAGEIRARWEAERIGPMKAEGAAGSPLRGALVDATIRLAGKAFDYALTERRVERSEAS